MNQIYNSVSAWPRTWVLLRALRTHTGRLSRDDNNNIYFDTVQTQIGDFQMRLRLS